LPAISEKLTETQKRLDIIPNFRTGWRVSLRL